ncbi:uncharacterized protein [Temnothorax longispinosus]|uniref:uncharacterized protein n=1 Tax=Temnothorax longispinosus TaxID=300112 RepID=UPI003A99A493
MSVINQRQQPGQHGGGVGEPLGPNQPQQQQPGLQDMMFTRQQIMMLLQLEQRVQQLEQRLQQLEQHVQQLEQQVQQLEQQLQQLMLLMVRLGSQYSNNWCSQSVRHRPYDLHSSTQVAHQARTINVTHTELDDTTIASVISALSIVKL